MKSMNKSNVANINLELFIKKYWKFYLELEQHLLETKRYVEFDEKNKRTFSMEYLKLLQACCSEIDVVGKIIAHNFDLNFDIKNSNIQKWGFIIHNKFENIETQEVIFNDDFTICPWEQWEYEQFHDTNNKIRYRLVKGKNTPKWWIAYNNVKHARVFCYTEEEINYNRANLENVVLAFSALFVLEQWFIQYLSKQENRNNLLNASIVFKYRLEKELKE